MRVPFVMLVLLVGLWVWSEVGYPRLARRVMPGPPVAARWFVIELTRGSIQLYKAEYVNQGARPQPEEWRWSFRASPRPRRVWLPYLSTQANPLSGLSLPLWIPMAPVAAWFGMAFVRHRRRIRVIDLCPCGYDARGLDVCPECGRAAKA
jgi:hypothetical protein